MLFRENWNRPVCPSVYKILENPVFTCLQYKSLENTVGKGEIAHNEQFLLSPQCSLPVWRTFLVAYCGILKIAVAVNIIQNTCHSL